MGPLSSLLSPTPDGHAEFWGAENNIFSSFFVQLEEFHILVDTDRPNHVNMILLPSSHL